MAGKINKDQLMFKNVAVPIPKMQDEIHLPYSKALHLPRKPLLLFSGYSGFQQGDTILQGTINSFHLR